MRVSDHLRKKAVQASTPEQWELAGKILDDGEKHPAIQALAKAYQAVLGSLKEAADRSQQLRKRGVGRTEDGSLILANVVPEIEALSKIAAKVAQQLQQKLD